MLRTLAVLLLTSAAFAAEPADLVLRGGAIVTIDDKQPQVEALAVRGAWIVAAGKAADVEPLIGPKTQVIELKGRMAMPGFIEGHGHFLSLGDSKRKLDLAQAQSWEEVVSLVQAEALKMPAGQWVVRRGWHQGKWTIPHANG